MTLTLRKLVVAAALATSTVAVAAPVFAEAPIYTPKKNNVAVQGYDPVAYFTDGEPTKGTKDYKTTYMGAEFHFASQENLDTFTANPEAYAPQYGGYCAWAIADGKYAKGSAKHWAIVDGKLYLNYNRSIQKKWNKDTAGFIERGDAQWSTLQGETSEPAGYGS